MRIMVIAITITAPRRPRPTSPRFAARRSRAVALAPRPVCPRHGCPRLAARGSRPAGFAGEKAYCAPNQRLSALWTRQKDTRANGWQQSVITTLAIIPVTVIELSSQKSRISVTERSVALTKARQPLANTKKDKTVSKKNTPAEDPSVLNENPFCYAFDSLAMMTRTMQRRTRR